MSKKKPVQNRSAQSNPVITIAIIGLVGTIITSLFAYLTTRTQIELPIQLTLTAASRPLLTSIPSIPIDTPISSTPESRNAGVGTQQATVDVTLSNNTQSTLEITITSATGFTIGLEIPPGVSQIITLPSDNYSYEYYYISRERALKTFRGSLHLSNPAELCFSQSGVTVCSASGSPVLIWIAGIAAVSLIVLLLVQGRKRTRDNSDIINS